MSALSQWTTAANFRVAGRGVDTQDMGLDGAVLSGATGWWAGGGDLFEAANEVKAANAGVMMAIPTSAELESPPTSLALALGLLATFCATMKGACQPAVYVFDPPEWRAVDPEYLMPADLVLLLFGEDVASRASSESILKAVWGRYRALDEWANLKCSESIVITMDKYDMLAHALHSLANYFAYAQEDQHLVDWPPFGIKAKTNMKIRHTLMSDMDAPLYDVGDRVLNREPKGSRWSSIDRRVVKKGLFMAMVGGAATAAIKGLKEKEEGPKK